MCEYLRSEALYNYMLERHICVLYMESEISSQIFIFFLQAIYQNIFSTAKSQIKRYYTQVEHRNGLYKYEFVLHFELHKIIDFHIVFVLFEFSFICLHSY